MPSASTARTTMPTPGASMIAHVRAAENKLGRRIRILMDIGGPKVRTATVRTPPDQDRLRVGDELLLVTGEPIGNEAPPFSAGCTLPQIFDARQTRRFRFDRRRQVARPHRPADRRRLRRADAGRPRQRSPAEAGERASIFPTSISASIRSPRATAADLDFIAVHADMVGYSFVETAAHVALLQDELAARRADWQNSPWWRRSRRRAPCTTCRPSSCRPPAGNRWRS